MSGLKTIKIEGSEGADECELCGWYDWGNYKVTFPDGTSFEYDFDTHMGGGSKEELDRKIWEHLGYELINEASYSELKQ